ncbi:MAG: hypothetical protein ACO1Q7_07860 [Gemmatimonas sp.]
MTLALHTTPWLLQASTLPDTIVTIPARSWMDYTSGTLQLIVLVLSVLVLGATAYVMLTLRKAIESTKTIVEKFSADTKPIIKQATEVAADAREVVAMLRTDVERVTSAAGIISDQVLNLADAVEERVDNLSAVIDVVQEELEETALSATATLRGARLGGRALAGGLSRAIMGTLDNVRNAEPRRRKKPRIRDKYNEKYNDPYEARISERGERLREERVQEPRAREKRGPERRIRDHG